MTSAVEAERAGARVTSGAKPASTGAFPMDLEDRALARRKVRRDRRRLTLLGIGLLLLTGAVAYWRISSEPVSKLKGANEDGAGDLARTFYEQAHGLVEQRRFDAALEKISPALEIDPSEADYYYLRGNILESLFRISEARQCYQEALTRRPDYRFAQENLDACQDLLQSVRGGVASNPAARDRLARLMQEQGRLAEASAMRAPAQPVDGLASEDLLQREDTVGGNQNRILLHPARLIVHP